MSALIEPSVAEADVDERRRRGRLVTVGVAVLAVVVVGVVALLGGFRMRMDLRTPVPIGTVIATGPYEVTVTGVTYVHATSLEEWKVVATGTARTTGTTSISPGTGTTGFMASRSETTREAEEVDSITIGDPDASQQIDILTPGLPPVPWSVTYRFKADPGPQILIGVFDLEYTTPYLFSDEKGWRATKDATTMLFTAKRLPDQEF